MEFIDLVKERYSCKSFKDEKVSKEIIEKILEIGSLAPTAKNSQPQKVYVLDSENAICTSENTHRAIHYSNEESLLKPIELLLNPIERYKNDTCPWRHKN